MSFRATGWHVERLERLRLKGIPKGARPKSMGAVIREAIALLWEQHSPEEAPASKPGRPAK